MTIRGAIRSIGPVALEAPDEGAPTLRRTWRAPLAAKLAAALVGLVVLVLLVNGAINTWLSYNQARSAALDVQEEKARSAAVRVQEFLAEIETQLGWTTGAEWRFAKPDQQRYDFVRLLRQVPAITELSYLDGQGREQLKVSRLEPDSVGSGKDFSGDPRFTQAVAEKIWFGPVEFRRGSEPYMTIALAHVGKNPGVTVADVNLKLIWDVISAIRVGDKGYAFVVDGKGRLIAHPDLSLVLRDTDFSQLPQVKAALAANAAEPGASSTAAPRAGAAEIARGFDGDPVLTAYAVAPKTRWIVFVQQPLAEALASVTTSLLQTLALLGLGLLLALIVGGLLARRMVVPIRRLQEGAERLGAGDLSQRLDIRTGDEIETLADRFNQMAESIKESYQTLEAKVEARTRDLNEALQQQTATAEVLKVISRSAFDLQAVFDTLTASAVELCGAFSGSICVRDGDVYRYRGNAGDGLSPAMSRYLAQHPATPGRGSIVGRVLLSGRVEAIPDILEHADYVVPLSAHGQVSRALLGVPLLGKGDVEGALVLTRKEPGHFTQRQIELVQTFADQAVIAIENARLFDELQARTRDLTEALQQQTATAEVLKVISRSAFDLQAVFDTLISSAVELIGGINGTIFVRDGESFPARAHSGVTPEFARVLAATPPTPGRQSATARVLLSGKTECIADVLTDKEYTLPSNTLNRTRSLLATPLLREDRIEGALVISRNEPGEFTQRQIDLVQTFADQAVIAIENVRLFNEVQAKTRDLEEALQQQTATADVLKVISRSAFELQTVLDTLVKSAGALIDAAQGAIYLRSGDAFHARAFVNEADQLAAYLRDNPQGPGRGSAAARILMTGEAQIIPDVLLDENYDPDLRAVTPVRALIGVPLKRDDSIIGAFVLGRAQPGPFAQRQIELVQTFADQAVIAIENVRLFDEVQAKTRDLEEALQQQTATANVLQVISRSAFDLQAVLTTLAESARDLCGASFVTLFMRDGDAMRLRAESGCTPEIVKFLHEHPIRAGRETFTGRVMLSGEAVHLTDVLADPEYNFGEAPRIGNYRAALGVPLLRNGQVEGVFALARPEPSPFSGRQIEMVRAFADQALIAVENARLFNEVQARTRDLSEALQQQTATAEVLKVISRSAFDLHAVFDTLVASAVELSGAYSGSICVRDGDVYRYRASAGEGTSEGLLRYLDEHPGRPGRGSILGRAVLSGRVEQISDILEDKEYAVPLGDYGHPARACIGVPLLSKDRVEGALVLTRREPGPYPQRQIEILQTFADQAVIAIENVRLFDEVQARTKELAASLDDLRKAQDRLIQSEKLASLGQLTAGIAHEIKNPLNFVNNFSSLSRELIDELNDLIAKAALAPAESEEAIELIGMVAANLDKVVSHGKRADSIVKNMLLHSREGSGERTSVTVNAMVEEALNLAYHGARAEKPGFEVTIVKSLDPAAGTVDLYAQEMTRVLLNLISNGFYATAKRRQSETAYQPTIAASTRDLGDHVAIAIRDNGTGVPDEVKAKMFNPFFTTKPAGEGTGLGLSLSYDIVVKQHGGTLDVSTELGSFTEFTIVLPRGSPARQEGSIVTVPVRVVDDEPEKRREA